MDRIKQVIGQYRYGILILLLGIGLMLLPEGGSEEVQEDAAAEPQQTAEIRLAEILSRIDGVGQTSVMLTVAIGEEVLYEYAQDISTGENSEAIRTEPVVITDENRREQGLIRQTCSSIYRGCLVVCQGGDDPAVKLAVVEAVKNVTGLTADRISVAKMK